MIASRSVFRYYFLNCSFNKFLLFLNFVGEEALVKTASLLYRDYSITKLFYQELESSLSIFLLFQQCFLCLFSLNFSSLSSKDYYLLLVTLLFLWCRFANYRALYLMISDISRRVRGSTVGSMRLLFFKFLALGLIGGFLAPLPPLVTQWLPLASSFKFIF